MRRVDMHSEASGGRVVCGRSHLVILCMNLPTRLRLTYCAAGSQARLPRCVGCAVGWQVRSGAASAGVREHGPELASKRVVRIDGPTLLKSIDHAGNLEAICPSVKTLM